LLTRVDLERLREARRIALCSLSADEALIDGEAVALKDGWSDFVALLTKHGRAQASFVAFDLAC
jgi:ATP-dependent DNA ligase